MRIATIRIAIVAATILIGDNAEAQEFQGRLFTYDERAREVSIGPGVMVRMRDTGRQDTTNDGSVFRLILPPGRQPGNDVTLELVASRWVLLRGGRWRIPEGVSRSVTDFEVATRGHPILLSAPELVRFVEEQSERRASAAVLANEASRPRSRPDFDLALREWAQSRGLGIAEVRIRLDDWARETLRTSDDLYMRGLALLAQQRFEDAKAPLDDASAIEEAHDAELEKQQKAINAERRVSQGRVLNRRLAQATGRLGAGAFDEARSHCVIALRGIDRRERMTDWARVQVALGDVERAWAKSPAPDGAAHAQAAVTAYTAASEVYRRDVVPALWATTQVSLANALRLQASRTVDDAGRAMLAKAVSTYRTALEVITRGEKPRDWAIVQNQLAIALEDLAERSADGSAGTLIAEVVATYRIALEVTTPETLPLEWALIHHNLGLGLLTHAKIIGGAAAQTQVDDAVSVLREALQVHTRETSPELWAASQNALGGALTERATYLTGERRTASLAQAMAALRAALEVRTRQADPLGWAATQTDLGRTLQAQSAWLDAEAAYRSALEVHARNEFPLTWAQIKHNLATMLYQRAIQETDASAMLASFDKAAAEYRGALEIRTPEALPRDWRASQAGLVATLIGIAGKRSGEAGRAAVVESVAALASLRQSSPSTDWDVVLVETTLLHDVLFDYGRARAILEERFQAGDLTPAIRTALAATLVTTQAWQDPRLVSWRDDAALPIDARVAIAGLATLAQLAQGQSAIDAMARLIHTATRENATGGAWSVAGIRHFIDSEPAFERSRAWAGKLLDVIASWQASTVGDRLRVLQSELPSLSQR